MKPPGVPPAELADLTRAEDRISFVYLERSVIHRDSNAITATDDRGVVHIPAATISVLLLGPGTSITHQAILLLADHDATAVWVGERGVRYYAHGRSLAASSRLLIAQATAVSNRSKRLAVARTMYAMRFPGEGTGALSMQQLRGGEGARVRRIYREHAKRTGVPWTQREYDRADFASGDPINQALSAAHTCLYGMVHAVIVALGAAPGLGFIHTGHERAFVRHRGSLQGRDHHPYRLRPGRGRHRHQHRHPPSCTRSSTRRRPAGTMRQRHPHAAAQT